ncbi:MAG: 2-oxo acid dehydrogenase subunit E2 [Anaerolineales bacterium]|nr:2-oxo acid dehydrogenase subunit E2 [Anaerolineales bacterium]
MITKVIVPQLGEGVEEVTITNWLKAEGDPVEEFEGLVEVETDKVVTEIPSPAAGTLLKIIPQPAGGIVPVGAPLAWIGEAGEEIPAGDTPPAANEDEGPRPSKTQLASPGEPPGLPDIPAPQPAETPKRQDTKLGFISPVVTRIAVEKGVDLALVPGTGLNGRITKKDVLAYLQSGPPQQPCPKPAPMPEQSAPQVQAGSLFPLNTIRKRIADHMLSSKRISAHVTTLMEADLSRVAAHRAANKQAFSAQGTRLTYTPYFIAAAASALRSFPLVNSSWREEGIWLHQEVNLGLATDLGEAGLIVPVIKAADGLSLLGIARAVNDLAARARSKQLTPQEVQGATFTITNHGVSGSLLATPIINQPQCAILGVGAIQKRVVVVPDTSGQDTIAIRPMVYLTLTFDHRILDGAGADHYLAKVVELLENWQFKDQAIYPI